MMVRHWFVVCRNMFSFLNITLFRPECEVNISYRARWLLELGTPLVLIYIVIIVWYGSVDTLAVVNASISAELLVGCTLY